MDKTTKKVYDHYEKKAAGFDRFMAPMEKMMMGKWRAKLVESATGEVLEAGVGTGANLPYYSRAITVTAIDFSPKMIGIAKTKINQSTVPIELMVADIQNLPFSDESFDTIITACVFCSVPDAIRGFCELKRVLKPKGKIYLLEHVRSENIILGPIMDMLNPLTLKISGVNINRKTEENIQTAGLKLAKVEHLLSDIVKLIVAYK